jgi:SET domain-containing protein
VPRAERGASAIAGRGLLARDPIATGEVFDGLEMTLLNHSCDPNLGWLDEARLVTLRDVAGGEELTVDYATFIDDPGFVMMCHCETYRCRQVIEGTDWQIPQLQRRYAQHWAPAVQRRIEGAR